MTERAIPIFEKTHHGSIAVFAFDNSSSHTALAKDSLNAFAMNLKDGGKQPILRGTVFNGQRQSLILPDGRPKGIQTILTERGLWKSNLRLFCGVKKTIVTNDDCCARHILAAQEDFKVNKPLLQEVIESMGHKVIFYPKFHPELNFIEQYWGAAKRYTRQHCDYTWNGLKETLPSAFDSISLQTIRKYALRSKRFMDCYRKGLEGRQAEFAIKKYKS